MELLVPWVVISFFVAVVFKVLPDARVRWDDVAVGAIVSGALLVLAKYGLTIYLSRASFASSYGAAGSLAILSLWLYVSAAVLLIGADFTRAWAQEHGRDVEPTSGAHRHCRELATSSVMYITTKSSSGKMSALRLA